MTHCPPGIASDPHLDYLKSDRPVTLHKKEEPTPMTHDIPHATYPGQPPASPQHRRVMIDDQNNVATPRRDFISNADREQAVRDFIVAVRELNKLAPYLTAAAVFSRLTSLTALLLETTSPDDLQSVSTDRIVLSVGEAFGLQERDEEPFEEVEPTHDG